MVSAVYRALGGDGGRVLEVDAGGGEGGWWGRDDLEAYAPLVYLYRYVVVSMCVHVSVSMSVSQYVSRGIQ